MVWTAPVTFVSNAVLSASQLNLMLRDNMNEQAPAKAANAGGYFASSGVNTIAERQIKQASVHGSFNTTSSSFVSASTGPSVSVTHSGTILVLFCARILIESGAGTGACAPAVVGQAAAATNVAVRHPGEANDLARMGGHALFTGMAAGTHTVRLEYLTSGGTASFSQREIIAMPL